MRKSFLLYIFVSIQIGTLAQQRTNLPYSVFGLGELNSKGSVRNMAMGKSGMALSSNMYISNLNPASYHNIDSVSFFFDFGLIGDFVRYKTSDDPAQHGTDINVKSIALGFRIMPKWTSSIGIAPYSTVGYKIRTEKYIDGTEGSKFDVEMTGKGGLNQLYWDNSYVLFKHLSLGVNFTYLFGNIESTETIMYENFSNDIIYKQTSYLNKVYADFGAQYFFKPNKDFEVNLGGVFGNSHRLNFKERIEISESNGEVSEDKISRKGTFDIPMYFGAGFAVIYKNQLTISADYRYNDWSSTDSDNPDYTYTSNNSFGIGAEYMPGRYQKFGYLGSIRYRAGYYFEQSYLEINKQSMHGNGFSVGIGLPFLQNRTSLNLTYMHGVNGSVNNGMIRESKNTIMMSLSMHDWWFIKRKFD